jgi:putative oxidoreductase
MKQDFPLTSPAKRYLVFGLRLILAGLFLYAGAGKILAPYHFAAAIQAYQLFPQFLVGLAAVFIPWLEVVSALALLGGCKPRSALFILGTLIILFMATIALTMARGLDIDCGCGLLADRPVGWPVLAEDALLLALIAWLYVLLLPQNSNNRPS